MQLLAVSINEALWLNDLEWGIWQVVTAGLKDEHQETAQTQIRNKNQFVVFNCSDLIHPVWQNDTSFIKVAKNSKTTEPLQKMEMTLFTALSATGWWDHYTHHVGSNWSQDSLSVLSDVVTVEEIFISQLWDNSKDSETWGSCAKHEAWQVEGVSITTVKICVRCTDYRDWSRSDKITSTQSVSPYFWNVELRLNA